MLQQPNKSLVINLQGLIEVHVNWFSSYEPDLINLINKGVNKIDSKDSIKYTVQFNDLAAHVDSKNPLPIPFNNSELESALVETFQNILLAWPR